MPDTPNTPSRIEINLGIALLVLLLIGSFMIMQPFLSSLMWALVLCYTLWPIQRRVIGWAKGRRTVAALITTLVIALVLVVPSVVIVTNLADDVRELGAAGRRWIEKGPPQPPAWLEKVPLIGRTAANNWREIAADTERLLHRIEPTADEQQAGLVPTTQPIAQSKLGKVISAFITWARKWLPSAGLAIAQGVTQVILSVFFTFFLFRDGEALAARLGVMLRKVAGERGTHALEVAGGTVRGVVYGILGTAVVQGLLAGTGFLIAGVPGAALLGLITFLVSPLPVGPPLIWIPASIYLFNQGHTGWGIFMIIWGLLVSSVDNVIKPLIISRGSATPFLLIFCGVLGGALAFGFIGVFLGPTLLAVAYRLIEDWSRGPIPPQSPAGQA